MKHINKKNFSGLLLLSRISSVILVFGLVLLYITVSTIFNKITLLENKKVIVEKAYYDLNEFKYKTETLLTAYNVDKKTYEYNKSYENYQKSILYFIESFENNHAIVKNNNMIKQKIEKLFLLLNSKAFTQKNHMNKPILVRLGELNERNSKDEYYVTIENLLKTIKELNIYQESLIEDLNILKQKVSKRFNKDIATFNTLFSVLPLFIILISIVIALSIDRLIKRKELKLVNTKTLLENIMNSIPMRIFWKNKDGIYLGANKLFVDDLNLTSSTSIIGKNDFEIINDVEKAKKNIKDDNDVMNSKLPKLNVLDKKIDDNGLFSYFNTSKVQLYDKYGKVQGMIGLYEDITSTVKNQKKIKQHEIQLVQHNRLAQMGEMISMIAHQWRQPLTIISTISGTLQLKIQKDRYDKDIFDERLKKIVLQTQHLSETIEDFRNFFKPDKKMVMIVTSDLIRQTLDIIEPTLNKFHIKINNNFNCEKEILTFPNEVKQVLVNIIKNAQDAFIENKIEQPIVNITTICNKDTKCMITIEDNAGGIPEDIIEDIFNPYFSTKDEKNGTGLGLYMSKMIIEDNCQGSINVSSSNGKTTFTIVL